MYILNRQLKSIHVAVIMFIYSIIGFTFTASYMGITSAAAGTPMLYHPWKVYGFLGAIAIADYLKTSF